MSTYRLPEVVIYDKKCQRRACSKAYKHQSKNSRYCSTACQQKDYKNKQKAKKEYNKDKEVHRMYARSHSLAVEVINQLVKIGEVSNECEVCFCKPVSIDKENGKKLEVHHKDFNWLNNAPSNLSLLCVKHHSELHSKINAQLKDEGKTLEDIYPQDMKPFFDVKLSKK